MEGLKIVKSHIIQMTSFDIFALRRARRTLRGDVIEQINFLMRLS